MLILESTATYNTMSAEPFYGDITAELLAISEDFHELDIKLARAEFQAFINEDVALKEEATKSWWQKIVEFFKKLWAKITGWFKGTVKKKEAEAEKAMEEIKLKIKSIEKEKIDFNKVGTVKTSCPTITENKEYAKALEDIKKYFDSLKIEEKVKNMLDLSKKEDTIDEINKIVDSAKKDIEKYKKELQKAKEKRKPVNIKVTKKLVDSTETSADVYLKNLKEVSKYKDNLDKTLQNIIETAKDNASSDRMEAKMEKNAKTAIDNGKKLVNAVMPIISELVNEYTSAVKCTNEFLTLVEKHKKAEIIPESANTFEGSILDQF